MAGFTRPLSHLAKHVLVYVRMRVNVDQRHRAVLVGDRPEDRQRQGVI